MMSIRPIQPVFKDSPRPTPWAKPTSARFLGGAQDTYTGPSEPPPRAQTSLQSFWRWPKALGERKQAAVRFDGPELGWIARDLVLAQKTVIHAASTQTLKDLYAVQKANHMPLVLAQCRCPAHLGTSPKKMERCDHPAFADATRMYALMAEAPNTHAHGLSAQKDDALARFCAQDFVVVALKPDASYFTFYATKSQMAAAVASDEVTRAVFFTSNAEGLTPSDKCADAIMVAAMYYGGLGVVADSTFAKRMFAHLLRSNPIHAQAIALICAVADNRLELLAALLALGVNPLDRTEEHSTVLDFAQQIRHKAAVAMLTEYDARRS